MNKNLFKVLALTLAMLMSMCVAVSAAAGITGTLSEGTMAVTVSGVGTGDEVTLLAVAAGTDLATVAEKDIIYIDQTTSVDGVATFSFTASTEQMDLYSGFTSMDVAQGALSQLYKGTGTDKPTIDADKTKVYEKAFDLAGYKRVFIKLTEENGQWMPAHTDAESAIYYSTEREGYDGLVKTTAADINAILEEVSWENVAPTADQTITKYGNANADSEDAISAADYANVKRAVMGNATYGLKQYLVADVNNDSNISAADYAQIKRVVMGAISSFAVANDK